MSIAIFKKIRQKNYCITKGVYANLDYKLMGPLNKFPGDDFDWALRLEYYKEDKLIYSTRFGIFNHELADIPELNRIVRKFVGQLYDHVSRLAEEL